MTTDAQIIIVAVAVWLVVALLAGFCIGRYLGTVDDRERR